MKLRELTIKHQQYYADKPTTDKYNGKITFFNEKGEAMTIMLREDQLLGIVELCALSIKQATNEAAQSIISSLDTRLQIEAA